MSRDRALRLARSLPLVALLAPLLGCSGLEAGGALVRYEDAEIAVDLPRGWATRRAASGALVAEREPGNQRAGLLQVFVHPAGESPEERVAVVAQKAVEGGARPLEQRTIAQGQSALAVVALDQPPTTLAMAGIGHARRGVVAVVTLAAEPATFEALGGTDLLLTIGASVRLGEASAPNGGERTAASGGRVLGSVGRDGTRTQVEGLRSADRMPVGSGADLGADDLVGSWRITNLDGSLDLKGLARTFHGTGVAYHFERGGRYTLSYKTRLTFGVQQSGAEVTERGRWRVASGHLTVDATGYRGWIANFDLDDKKPLAGGGSTRLYRLARSEGTIVLVGPCADFQLEPACKRGQPMAFPLTRR